MLALQDVGQGLELALLTGGGNNGLALASAVVDQSVDGLLEHALFVAADNFWSVETMQTTQTIVAVNDAAVQVVQVRSGETATIKWNHWTQVWWNNWDNAQNHPTWGNDVLLQAVEQLEATHVTVGLGFAGGFGEFFGESSDGFWNVDAVQHL